MASKNDFFLYWDSCVFTAWINQEDGRVDTIKDRWNEVTQEKKGKVITSTLAIAEVAHTAKERKLQRLDQQAEQRISEMWQDSDLIVVEASRFIMEMARDLMREGVKKGFSLRAYDAIHLATAKFMETNGYLIQEINTYDKKVEKYAVLVGIDICEPHFEPKPTQRTLDDIQTG